MPLAAAVDIGDPDAFGPFCRDPRHEGSRSLMARSGTLPGEDMDG